MLRFLTATLISIAATAAFADDARPVDLTKPILNLDGKPVMEDGVVLTVGGTAGSCLAKEAKGPAYWELAERLVSKEPVTLTTAEVHAIVECVKKLPAIIDGQIEPAVDPTYKPKPID